MAKVVEREVYIVLEGYPDITRDQIDGVNIGRALLPEQNIGIWTPNETFLRFYNALNGKSEHAANLRGSMVFSLNNNSACTSEGIEHQRGLSAYYTYNPNDRIVILEWGMINSQGDAKLHTYLNQVIDYTARATQGMQLSSGHLAKVTGTDIYLAYLDRLSINNRLAPNEPMAKMVNSLHGHGFIPLTSEGFIQIPFF